jgi:hypothetical protein
MAPRWLPAQVIRDSVVSVTRGGCRVQGELNITRLVGKTENMKKRKGSERYIVIIQLT